MIRYNPRGLSPNEVAESRRQHGDNVITPPKDDSVWKLLADKFRDPIIRILLLAAVLSLAIGFVHKDFTESIGIICAIILATCVGFWFEWDAMRRFRRLNQVNDDIPVKVMRDGAMHEVPRRDVVVGDVVYIESGETVPVDGELVEAVSLRINESTLTGELEVDKTVDEAHFDPDATYPSNVVLRGTTVADGYGVMVSTAVGDATEAGRVTEQATVQSEEQTPLNRQLTRLSKLIGRAGIVLSIAIFCVMLGKAIFINGLLEGDWLAISQHVLHIFMVSVAIIVMAVPEGLPMSITLSLAMSMRRMLKTNNLVRRMHACETMGAVTVICTDKTGTLTQNRMHVQELVRYDALPMHDFAEIVAANSTAFLDVSGAVIGNPTEGALLEWLHAQGEDYEPLRAGAKIVDRLTFSTERKYMATIIQSGISGRRIVCVKGAPEIVRAMCAPDGKDEQVAEQLLGFQGRAMRTLAVAWAETAEDDCQRAVAAAQLHFAGVAAISDPVREDVPEAVGRCLKAGIDVKIVTGDTPATAREIARVLRFPSAIKREQFCRQRFELIEYRLADDNPLVGLQLSDLYRNIRVKILICAVARGSETIIPTGMFTLRAGDKIYLTASARDLESFFRKLNLFKAKASNVMIVGASRMTYYLVKELQDIQKRVTVIDSDAARCQEMSEKFPGVLVIHGDGADAELLSEERITDMDAFVALTGLDETNIILAMYASQMNSCKVVAKINRESFAELAAAKRMVDSVVSTASVTSESIAMYVRAMQNSFESENIKTLHRLVSGRVEALEFNVAPGLPFIGVPLKDLTLRKGLLVAGIVRRNGQTVIPSGNDALQEGDDVVIVTTDTTLHSLRDIVK